MMPVREKFKSDGVYAIDGGRLLNRLRGIRDKLNSLYALGYDERRDMGHILFLIEQQMIEIKGGLEDEKG